MKEAHGPANLYWMLLQVTFRSKHGLMRLAEKHDLTVVQLYVLWVMQPHAPIPMNMLSELLLCDASNVTGIAERLLARDYIKREESPTDRRIKMITLTQTGEELRSRLFNELPDYELPEFRQLTPDQRKSLRSALETILASLDKL